MKQIANEILDTFTCSGSSICAHSMSGYPCDMRTQCPYSEIYELAIKLHNKIHEVYDHIAIEN